MHDRYRLTESETVTVRSRSPEFLEVEGEWGPGGSPPPAHLHPAQDERFEVLAGTLRVRIDGAERDLAVGDVLEVPRGTVHGMWNPGDVPARAAWQTRPALRTEEWFAAVDRSLAAGPRGRVGLIGQLPRFRDVFVLKAGPEPVVYGALTVVSPLARLLGR
jgi:mannose-6-phosphate isomerase-like protein (cupin superfamily)